jgi:hypothetical protein
MSKSPLRRRLTAGPGALSLGLSGVYSASGEVAAFDWSADTADSGSFQPTPFPIFWPVAIAKPICRQILLGARLDQSLAVGESSSDLCFCKRQTCFLATR